MAKADSAQTEAMLSPSSIAPYIEKLRLTDFRSYDQLDITLDGRPVILTGPNGAGKTNLLEAVSLLSPGRGLRRAKVDALARLDGDMRASAWGVVADLNGYDTARISIGQVPENPRRRIVRIDGQNTTATALSQYLTLVWLTPAQDRLFTGPASDRRKFLDRFCLVHAPGHGMRALRYEKARAERNRLLGDGIMDAGWYDALEADMAVQGAHIAQARAMTITSLIDHIDDRPEGAFPKAVLDLDGEAEGRFLRGDSFDDIEHGIKDALHADRPIDRRAGRTLRGVHKSDLRVAHAAKAMPAELCSTGEQKALLIGLFLAHARAQADKKPILLLDEVAAHLDDHRRAAMTEDLLDLGTQCFLTGTDASLFEAFARRSQSFHVEEGTLTARDV